MKNKALKRVLIVMTAAALGGSSPAVWAGDEPSAAEALSENVETKENAGTDTALETDSVEEAKIPAEVKISLETEEIALKNNTDKLLTAVCKKNSEKEQKEDTQRNEWELLVTEADGKEHIFENVAPDKWQEPSLSEEYGFLYIKYTDESGKEQELLETSDEIMLEEALTVYTITSVNVRKEGSKESQSLKVADPGTEWKVVGGIPGWVKVEGDSIEGYIFHNYVTQDKEKIDEMLRKKEEEAVAAQSQQTTYEEPTYYEPTYQEPVYQEPVYQEPTYQEPAYQEPTQEEVYEVSRQAFDDCDGSGHGYYEITYSDGSVGYEEY